MWPLSLCMVSIQERLLIKSVFKVALVQYCIRTAQSSHLFHCKRISCHIVHLAHQLLHLRTSESMKLSLESLAFHILHLHIQFEDFSFLMVDLGLCFLHIRKWLCIYFDSAAMLSLPREWTDLKPNHFSDDEEYGNMGCGVFKQGVKN